MAVILKTKPFRSQAKQLIIIVSKAVVKKASERNLLKRRIRAIMQPILKQSNNDYMVIVRSDAPKSRYTDLKREINEKSSKQ